RGVIVWRFVPRATAAECRSLHDALPIFSRIPRRSSRSGEVREVIGIQEVGLLRRGGRAPSLVRGLERAMEADDQRAELGRQGRRSEEHTSELQSRENLVCRLLLEEKKTA